MFRRTAGPVGEIEPDAGPQLSRLIPSGAMATPLRAQRIAASLPPTFRRCQKCSRITQARQNTPVISVPSMRTARPVDPDRSEEHTSELQSLMRISYAVFCLKKKKNTSHKEITTIST